MSLAKQILRHSNVSYLSMVHHGYRQLKQLPLRDSPEIRTLTLPPVGESRAGEALRGSLTLTSKTGYFLLRVPKKI